MKTLTIMLAVAFLSVAAQASDEANLIKKLGEAKMSLKEAILFAEQTSGPATSAKFELDGQDLVFSVYTAPQGLQTSAEQTDLTELSGKATLLPLSAKTEVFTDKEHLARASTHLTLMQLSRLTLSKIIDIALSSEPGIAYSVKNPRVKDHRAVAEVLILEADGDVETVTVDMLTGKVL